MTVTGLDRDIESALESLLGSVEEGRDDPASMDDERLLRDLTAVSTLLARTQHVEALLMEQRNALLYAGRYRSPRAKTLTLATTAGMTESAVNAAVNKVGLAKSER